MSQIVINVPISQAIRITVTPNEQKIPPAPMTQNTDEKKQGVIAIVNQLGNDQSTALLQKCMGELMAMFENEDLKSVFSNNLEMDPDVYKRIMKRIEMIYLKYTEFNQRQYELETLGVKRTNMFVNVDWVIHHMKSVAEMAKNCAKEKFAKLQIPEDESDDDDDKKSEVSDENEDDNSDVDSDEIDDDNSDEDSNAEDGSDEDDYEDDADDEEFQMINAMRT